MNDNPKKAIMVVDDDVLLTMALKMELQRRYGEHYAIESAYNATAAQKLMAELAEDEVLIFLIISDWMMPGMHGDALLELIRRQQPQIKTILLSGYACEESVERLYATKCLDAFISKPWTASTLFGTVDRLLEIG